MKLILVAVRDRKIAAFQPPFSVRAEGEAIRNFQDAVNDQANRQLHNHADDFELYRIGTFNDEDASIELETPKLIAHGGQLKV